MDKYTKVWNAKSAYEKATLEEPEEYGTDDPSAGTVDGTDDQDPSEAGFTDPDGEAKDGADDENGPEDAR